MPRLPVPGDDSGQWGDILNDYLSVAHNPDGSLKDPVPDASPTVKGRVQLAGDLSGTASAPTVVSTSLTDPLPIDQGGTGANTAPGAINALLPNQTGNSNKILQTDGTNVSWQDRPSNDDILALTWMEVSS
jgi:hypothetical protein